MKKLILLLFIIVLIGCDTNTVVQNTDFEVGAISGDISYLNLLTNLQVSDNDSINVELTSIGDNPVSIPSGVNTTSTGSSFEFGPLNFGKYKLSTEFTDDALGVTYSAVDSVEITSSTSIRNIDITMVTKNQTIILGELLNSSNMPISEADTFLYNDSIALQQFRGLGGFIDNGSSNQLGRTVFSDHVEGEYYVLGRLIIENDTLFSKTENLTPTIVTNSDVTTVTSIIEFN